MKMIIQDCFQSIREYVADYIDIDYSIWLSWCLAPLLITFLLPAVIAVLLYISAFIIYVHKLHWTTLRTTLQTGDRWELARRTTAVLWDAHGWIWHGYEVKGVENLADAGNVLFIYYHGAIPIDFYYFLAHMILHQDHRIQTVADHFLFKIPGFSIIADCMKVIPGTVQTCANALKDASLAISPGGVYEAQFSHHYDLMWKKRLGFAKVALEAKVPIVPLFTENVREAFRTVSFGRRMFLRLYAALRFPLVPIYGGFPVKLITHVGKPIQYDPNLTPEDLQKKVAAALTDLIKSKQRIPGSIFQGLLARIPYFQRKYSKHHVS